MKRAAQHVHDERNRGHGAHTRGAHDITCGIRVLRVQHGQCQVPAAQPRRDERRRRHPPKSIRAYGHGPGHTDGPDHRRTTGKCRYGRARSTRTPHARPTHAPRTPHGDTATVTGLGHSRGCAAEVVERPRHLRRKAQVSELDVMVVVRRREQQAHFHFHFHFHARRSSRRGGVGRARGVIRTMAPRHDPPPPRPSPELKRSGEIVS